MSRSGSFTDFDHFDEWETIDLDDDIYAGTETDVLADSLDPLADWEDDGAIAEVRSPVRVTGMDKHVDDIEVPEESAEVFSLLERANSKRSDLGNLSGPSEDELANIEEVGIDDYIDAVLDEAQPETSSDTGDRPLAHSHASDVREQALDPQTVPPLSAMDVDEQVSEVMLDEDVDVQDEDPEMHERTLEHGSESAQGSHPEISNTDLETEFNEEESELVVTPLFYGVGCALPTLFDEDGDVEYKTTARFAKRLLDDNVASVFVATNEGEGATLSRKERKSLVAAVSKVTDAWLIADVSAPSTRQSVQLADDVLDAGANALLIELDANTRDPYGLCEALHTKHYDTPIIVRLIGDASLLPITPEFLYDLPIASVIDATGDATFLLHLTSTYAGPVYIGAVSTLLMGHALDVAGVVLGCAAIYEDLVTQAFSGDVDAQQELAMIERDCGGFTPHHIKLSLETEHLISATTRE